MYSPLGRDGTSTPVGTLKGTPGQALQLSRANWNPRAVLLLQEEAPVVVVDPRVGMGTGNGGSGAGEAAPAAGGGPAEAGGGGQLEESPLDAGQQWGLLKDGDAELQPERPGSAGETTPAPAPCPWTLYLRLHVHPLPCVCPGLHLHSVPEPCSLLNQFSEPCTHTLHSAA